MIGSSVLTTAGDEVAVRKGEEEEDKDEEDSGELEAMKGVFEDAKRHLKAAEAGVGEKRWQG